MHFIRREGGKGSKMANYGSTPFSRGKSFHITRRPDETLQFYIIFTAAVVQHLITPANKPLSPGRTTGCTVSLSAARSVLK